MYSQNCGESRKFALRDGTREVEASAASVVLKLARPQSLVTYCVDRGAVLVAVPVVVLAVGDGGPSSCADRE